MKRLWLVLILSLVMAVPSMAQSAIYAKFDAIDGEVNEKDHDRWCAVESVSWAMDAPYSQRTGKVGDSKVKPLSITKPIDKATPILMSIMYNGGVIPRVEIDLVANDSQSGQRVVYMTYELRNVQISDYSTNTSADERRGTEKLTLNYAELRVRYYPETGPQVDFIGPWK